MKFETCRVFCDGMYLAVTRVNPDGVRVSAIIDAADMTTEFESADKKAFAKRAQELVAENDKRKADKAQTDAEKALEDALR